MNEFTAEQMEIIRKMESDHASQMAKLEKLHLAVKGMVIFKYQTDCVALGKRLKLENDFEKIEKLGIYEEETLEKLSISPVAQVLALDSTEGGLQLGPNKKTNKKMIAVKGMVIFIY